MAYLQAHPDVRVVARDRDARYAEAIRWAAPQALVVLDRWHLLRNYTDAFERLVARRHATWRRAQWKHAATLAVNEGEVACIESAIADLPPAQKHARSRRIREQRDAKRQARQELFNRAHELHKLGHSKTAIAKDVGLSQQTVVTYL